MGISAGASVREIRELEEDLKREEKEKKLVVAMIYEYKVALINAENFGRRTI